MIFGLYDMHWRWEGGHTNKIERLLFLSLLAME